MSCVLLLGDAQVGDDIANSLVSAYTYDLLGRLTSAATSSQTLSFTYDALGRNLTQVGPQGTLTSTYDVAGRRTRLTHPDGFYVDQDWLVTGELQAIRENGATSGVGVLATHADDDLGRRPRPGVSGPPHEPHPGQRHLDELQLRQWLAADPDRRRSRRHDLRSDARV